VTVSSVIIVSYRPGDWLAHSVDSAVAQADEVVVVDNGSAGEEASAIGRRAGARTIRCRTNLGFTGGVAAGLRAVGGDLIGILNDDAVAEPSWMPSAAAAIDERGLAAVTPKVVLAGLWREVILPDETWYAPGDARPLGRQIRSVTAGGDDVLARVVGSGVHHLEQDAAGSRWRWTSGSQPWYVPVGGGGTEVVVDGDPAPPGPVVRLLNHAGSFLRQHGVAGEIGLGAPDDGRFDSPAEVFGFSGTAPVFSAAALARVGKLAVPFFAYNEDTDWCVQAHLQGLRVGYEPRGVVTHRLSATSGGPSSVLVRRLQQRNALLCLIRGGPRTVVRRELQWRLKQGLNDPVLRGLMERLPWAVTTRAALRRRWSATPEEVWEQWVDRGAAWDTSPARG
jgi:GT2 family glycosyltransferase